MHGRTFSFVLHLAVLALALLAPRVRLVPPAQNQKQTEPVRLHFLPVPRSPSGGGGNLSPRPPAKGVLPRLASRQFVPPVRRYADHMPLLWMEPAIVAEPVIQTAALDSMQFGVAAGAAGPPGGGGKRGIGGSGTGGLGNSDGPGSGGRGSWRLTGAVTAPVPVYNPEPEFSEEARKAKFEGTVVVEVQISAAGRVTSSRVRSGAGMGLDEKALEAVSQWRFRPAMRDGKPVAAAALVEVNFHLL